jgi:hypothetical protein
MKVYIVEMHRYDEVRRLDVCASIDKAKEILKDIAEALINDVDGNIEWDEDGLGFAWDEYGLRFLYGCTRYQIIETELIQ